MKAGGIFGTATSIVLLIWLFWIAVIVGAVYILFHPALIGEWFLAVKGAIH